MKHNMHEWRQRILEAPERSALPILTYPGLELVGKTVREVITDGRAQYETIKALTDKYPSLAALTIMDLSVEAEAFGCPIRYAETEVPTVTARIVADMETAECLRVPVVGEGRTFVYLTAAQAGAEGIRDRPVFGGLIGPFSLAARLMDMTEIMINVKLEPDLVLVVLEKCAAFLVEYAKAFKKTGANGIIIAEPAAGLLPPDLCETFSSSYVRQIVAAVQDDYFLAILHNCGNTKALVPSMLGTGAAGLHFGNAVDLTGILPQVRPDVLAFGNIDPAGVFKNGAPLEMTVKTTELLEKMGPYPNFVLSSGCDVPPGTSLANVDAFYQALIQYNRYHQKTVKTSGNCNSPAGPEDIN